MKICLINNLYKPYARGGAEKIVDISAQALVREYEVFIISTKPHNAQRITRNDYYLPSFYYNLNKVPVFFRLFWHVWDVFDFVTCFRIYRILKKEKPDLVVTHNLKGVSFLIPQLLRFLKIRHIHTLHDVQLIHPSGLMFYKEEKKIDGIFARTYQEACRLLFGSPDKVISPSKWLLELHASRGFFRNSKKERIVNPSAVLENNAVQRSEEIKTFLYVGQVEKHKGVEILINAFKKLEGDYELLIAGPGSLFSELKEEAKDARIKFLGGKSREEVRELMQKADCLIVPSLCYENAPNVILEAFANNLPVIASNLGGIPELLDYDQNFLFRPEEDDLLEKMRNFKKIPQKQPEKLSGEEYVKKILKIKYE